jgi:LuxR family maltose regulon positive regulatory protein
VTALLTERELAVLRLLRGSLTAREIAEHLELSPNTIKTHTRAVYHKLGVCTRRDAVNRAQATGILPPAGGKRHKNTAP